jgi:hypothetical protein
MDDHPLTADGRPGWGPVRRLTFRFLFVYLVLFNLGNVLQIIPFGERLGAPYAMFWGAAVPWTGRHVLHVEVPPPLPYGSGDSMFNYVQAFCTASISVAAAAAWSLLDRRRRRHDCLYAFLRVLVRYSLAAIMITYGAVKVIQSQFPPPSLDRLVQPFGEASPMGLLWTFMGASRPYNVFCGLLEMVGGLLLAARRTTLLGALLSIAALGNVVVLNFSYDVPVKLYSMHLLAMAVFLAAPDVRRLADLFLFNRPVEPAPLRPVFRRAWACRVALVLWAVAVLGFVGQSLVTAREMRKAALRAEQSPLYGIWDVEEFAVDGEARPPVAGDAAAWRRVVSGYPGVLSIHAGRSPRRFKFELDAAAGTLALGKRDDPAWHSTLACQRPEAGLMVLDGTFDGKPIRAKLRRADERQFLLLSRGFHWVSEVPFNR